MHKHEVVGAVTIVKTPPMVVVPHPIMEIQINGGKDAAARVDFAKLLFEKEIGANTIFAKDANIDILGVTKGGAWMQRCHDSLGCHTIASKDPSWSQEGCLHWIMASCPICPPQFHVPVKTDAFIAPK